MTSECHWFCPGSSRSTWLQSVYMIMKQLSGGKAEVENQYAASCSTTATRQLFKVLARSVFTLRPFFEWRGLGSIPHSALALWHPNTSDSMPSSAVRGAGGAGRRPQSVPVRRSAQGRAQALGMQGFGTACTPETPIGTCMVSSEGACAAYYNYGRMNRIGCPRR